MTMLLDFFSLGNRQEEPQQLDPRGAMLMDLFDRAKSGSSDIASTIAAGWQPTVTASQPAPAPAPATEQPRPAFQPTFGDRMMAFGNALQGHEVASPAKLAEAKNQTLDFLTKRGVSPDEAKAMVSNPQLLQATLPSLFASKTIQMNNKLIDSRTGRVIADYSDSARQGPEIKTVKTPYGDDVSVQYDAKQGRYIPIKVGMGGGGGAPGAVAGGQPGYGGTPGLPPPPMMPKHAREALQTAEGKAMGEARAGLPKAEQNAAYLLKQIDELANHKSLDKAVGYLDGALPSMLPGTRDVDARIAQIQGGTFLQAFESLKGAGQITEKEGEKATAALNRLQDQRQGEEGYRQALKDFRKEVVDLTAVARRRAGMGPAAKTSANDPLGLR